MSVDALAPSLPGLSSTGMPEVQIVKYSQLDQKIVKEALARINKAINWSHYNGDIEWSYLKEDTIFFGLKEKEIVGYVTFREYFGRNCKKNHPRPHFYIPYIAVDPEMQGSKGGSVALKMMMKVIEVAKSAQVEKIVLDFRGNNPKTRGFYEKVGTVGKVTYKDKDNGFYGNSDPRIKRTFCIAMYPNNENKE